MLNTNGAAARARWAVMWIYVKNGKKKVFRKDFKDDYASARTLYQRAREAGKPYATLACVNMGFPPPVELRPHTIVKVGRSKSTGKKRRIEIEVDKLKELNMQGTVWCPYCCELRQFILQKYFKVGRIRVESPRYVCPLCKASHQDHNVRAWNPTAEIHMTNTLATKTRAPRSTPKRRRRRARA